MHAGLVAIAPALRRLPRLEILRTARSATTLRRRQQRPQLFVGAAEVHDEARLERVAQLAQDDALLVATQLGQRHRDARALSG